MVDGVYDMMESVVIGNALMENSLTEMGRYRGRNAGPWMSEAALPTTVPQLSAMTRHT